MLLAYVIAWVVSRVISDTNLDAPGDMLESVAWGQQWIWGTVKHPPLMTWIAGAWFTLAPTNDASYHLLAYLVSGLGLLGVYQLARAFGLEKIALAAVLLTSVALPFSNLAVRFNANTVLLIVWPWLAWSWLKAIHEPSYRYAILLGLLAAMSILGKYYSGVILLSIGIATLTTPSGRKWLLSRYCIVAVSSGALLLAPHLYWLLENNFPTFQYLDEKSEGREPGFQSWIRFAFIPLIYCLIPWLFIAWIYAPGESIWIRVKHFSSNLIIAWKPQKAHLPLFILVTGPWLFTLAIGATGAVILRTPFAIPIVFACAILWLVNLNARHQVDLEIVTRKCRNLFAVWLCLVVGLAPVYAWQQANRGAHNFYLPRAAAAQELLAAWNQDTNKLPLKWASGFWPEQTLVSFYGRDDIRILHGLPGQFPATVNEYTKWQTEPGLFVCPLGSEKKPFKSHCPSSVEQWFHSKNLQPRVIEIEVAREGFRFSQRIRFRYRGYIYLPEFTE